MKFANLALGIQDFEKMRKNRTFYVDKTDFIREWWHIGSDVTLITRPRRFGKTLNMSMINCFFSNKYSDRQELFEGLSVSRDKEMMEMQGTYPVISLTFSTLKHSNYREFKLGMLDVLKQAYEAHPEVAAESFFDDAYEQKSKCIRENKIPDISAGDLAGLMTQLSKKLHDYYGKKVIILLDEYDTPMQEAYLAGYWDKAVELLRMMFNSAFKSNDSLERALLTGITRISKESLFSDFNNADVVTTMSNKYATAFGFTESEVFAALEEYDMSEKEEEVKIWYDGFRFCDVEDIYNPWSIINFLEEKKFTTYWVNTSSNGLVSELIRCGDAGVKETMEDLLLGYSFYAEIDEQIVLSQLGTSKDAVWSFLLAAGYLKVVSYERQENGKYLYGLKLTNHEVMLMFERLIRDWFAGTNSDYNGFIQALLANHLDDMNDYLNDVLGNSVSFYDTGSPGVKQRAGKEQGAKYRNQKNDIEKKETENFYHALVLGMLAEMKDRYHIRSNRESGYGRYDVMLEPKNTEENAYVLEFKVFNSKRDKSLLDAAQKAMKQITDKDYDRELLSRGIGQEQISHYGFAFREKEVLVVSGDV